MVWLEAQHVLEPGQSAVEKAEKYVADARMEWPLARMMLAELSHIPVSYTHLTLPTKLL